MRLLDETRATGYAGGYTQLKALVQRVRPHRCPSPGFASKHPPGRQAQVDFARCTFPWGIRYALLLVLGYSRLLRCRFYPPGRGGAKNGSMTGHCLSVSPCHSARQVSTERNIR